MRCGLPFKGTQVDHVSHFTRPPSLGRSSPQPSATSESERLRPETGPGRDRPAHCQETQRAVLCLSVGQCPSVPPPPPLLLLQPALRGLRRVVGQTRSRLRVRVCFA